MSAKNETEVTIGGKTLTLSGYESEEYLQKVANYINGKIADFKKSDSYRRQSFDMQAILLELNIADDYFKIKKLADELDANVEDRDKEIYDLKHELISIQIKLDSVLSENAKLKEEAMQNQKSMVKLETELEHLRK